MARTSARNDIADAYNSIGQKSIEELRDIVKDKNQPAVTVLMASSVLHGIKSGDWSRYDKLLDRLLGKTKESIELKAEVKGGIEIDWLSQK